MKSLGSRLQYDSVGKWLYVQRGPARHINWLAYLSAFSLPSCPVAPACWAGMQLGHLQINRDPWLPADLDADHAASQDPRF